LLLDRSKSGDDGKESSETKSKESNEESEPVSQEGKKDE